MKTNLFQRFVRRLSLTRPKKNQGVAILTVLAIITLMTVLVVSFFNMAQTSKTTAKGSVEIQRVTTLKDTIINLVIAQFREASKLAPASDNPRDIITWTSQPGAIRTFSGTTPANNRLYKLYSSNVPQISNIRPFENNAFITEVNRDNVSDWAERPDEFTDLNRPVYTAATGDRAAANTGNSSVGFTFPIADPRAYNGGKSESDIGKNVEGFTYGPQSGSTTINGVDPRKEQLAMPVRWIYLLQDGTLGYLDSSGEFSPLNGGASGEISRENPIAGRLAWWADDESCKINVNTASVPAAWDTPRTTSQEDQWLARNQPIAGEYQRYPGHPAGVDLSAVFFPNRRWVPPDLAKILKTNPAGGKMELLKQEDAVRMWNLAPFIVGDKDEVSGGSVGTGGGIYPTPKDSTVGLAKDDRLFTSMDEVYFKASGTVNKSLNAPRTNLFLEGKDEKLDFLKQLQRSQFFLTHKSHSPEMTNQGFPRVSMFPMAVEAVKALTDGKTENLPVKVSPFDVTIALNSSIGTKSTSIVGGNVYFFQRSDSGSRHNELYNGVDSRQRNFPVLRYLKELSKLPIPGFPEIPAFEVQSAKFEDPLGLSLASKYPAGLDSAGKPITSVGGSSAVLDASDRTQILLNMLDYTRAIAVQPAFVTQNERYDSGYGQVTGICGCAAQTGSNTNAAHKACLEMATQSRSPKGSGKRYGPAEITMIVNVAGSKRSPTAAGDAGWNSLVTSLSALDQTQVTNAKGVLYIAEVGFVMSSFTPKTGFGASYVDGGLGISTTFSGGQTGNDASDPMSSESGATVNKNGFLPILYNNVNLEIQQTARFGVNTSRRMPTNDAVGKQGVLPFGGLSGPRTSIGSAGNSIARTRPFLIKPGSGASQGSSVTVTLGFEPQIPIRIMPTDSGAGYGNVIQAVDLLFPPDFFSNQICTVSGTSLEAMAPLILSGQLPFPGNLNAKSFVLPHGDYRLSATPSRVDADLFVPVSGYNSPQAQRTSFFEMNSVPDRRVSLSTRSFFQKDIGLLNKESVKKFILPTYNNPGEVTNDEAFSALPLPLPDIGRMSILSTKNARFPWREAGTTGNPSTANGLQIFHPGQANINTQFSRQGDKVYAAASRDVDRQAVFSHGRRDGDGKDRPDNKSPGAVPMRGSSDPSETGDFDTGVAALPDGPYMNYPDEGDRRANMNRAYFYDTFTENKLKNESKEGVSGQQISPNFLVRSPVDFGSIPSGIASRVPWQTLRFRPDPGMNDPQLKMKDVNNDAPPRGMPFANFCGPKDHFFLDMFWMPVVEPWAISEPFSTKGTINLNQQILPFMNIDRTTALHALLRGERMYAIPNTAAENYKKVDKNTGEPNNTDPTYRRFINAEQTVRQFLRRYKQGTDMENFPLAFNVFRSASEICEVWLAPESDGLAALPLEDVIGGRKSNGEMFGFWEDHKLTGDNLRERPYANLYPRVTVRSNVFKLHMVAQTLQKATSQNPKSFDSTKDSVTAEWRGSCMIERSIDPRDVLLNNVDYSMLNSVTINQKVTPKLDRFYTYRVTEVKQLTQ